MHVVPMGDAALLMRWTGLGSMGDPGMIAAAYRAIRAARQPGVVDVVPAPASVLVRFDPHRVSGADLRRRLPGLVGAGGQGRRSRAHRVSVHYGGSEGPDLAEVAGRLGLSPAEVVERHAAGRYTVLATGFTPGFIYAGPLPRSLRLARRAEPRVSVPAGSIAIADAQTGIYGVRSGGGWWLIGRAAVPTFDPGKRPPTPFSIGDRVAFEAVG